VAFFQLESSSNEEMEFERVRFREKGRGCFHGQVLAQEIENLENLKVEIGPPSGPPTT
jgi:hypothetical protein